MSENERFIFRHFCNGLAIGGALAEWGLACWLLGSPPLALHLIVLPLLVVLNRLAARRLESEPATGLFAGTTGHVICATAFTALSSVTVIGMLASGWALVWLLGALSAEAGAMATAVTKPAFGPGFQAIAMMAAALTIGLVAHGYVRGYRRLVVTALVVPLPDLPAALAGLRIIHVSDFHLGPLADRPLLREGIDRVLALDPDLVCVTGDLIDSPATDVDSWMPELGRLTARHGVFAILGNHDIHTGKEQVAAAVRRWTDWRLLRDEAAVVEIAGARLHILGLEHRRESEAADGVPALAAQGPPGEPAIMLVHHPLVFPACVAAGARLVLAGHTHGGQLALPGVPGLNIARFLITRYSTGCYRRGETLMHVNRGMGTSGQRVRVGAPAEITVMTLVPSAARAG